MAKSFQISAEYANAALDAGNAKLNGGKLRFYQGTKPANVADALAGVTLLAELSLSATAFAAASAAAAAANAITGDTSADATGTAQFYRAFKADGTTAVCQGTVGVTGSTSDIELNSTALTVGAAVNVTAWNLSQGLG